MDLFLNDLSFQGQFQNITQFKDAIKIIMKIRSLASRYGRQIYCHRSIVQAKVTYQQILSQVLHHLDLDERRTLMQWFSQQGPYWDDYPLHSSNDYLEYNGEIITDSGLGEAAFGLIHGHERRVTSLSPSTYQSSVLPVKWIQDNGDVNLIELLNYWSTTDFERALINATPPVDSWKSLSDLCRNRFQNLTYYDDCFDYLQGHPFVIGASQQIISVLGALDRFAFCFDEHGQRTPEGQKIYQDHFTGDKAWFSDSSDSEKRNFNKQLTFAHPTDANKKLFCPWHGKIKTPQLRIHFSWPIVAKQPIYIVYIGPKITKQ